MYIETKRLHNDPNGMKWEALNSYTYHSSMFNQDVKIEKGYKSDGATGAPDIHSDAWWIHDKLCDTGEWESGDKVSNFAASTVLGNILFQEGHIRRSFYWWWATFLFGGGKARENGLFRLARP